MHSYFSQEMLRINQPSNKSELNISAISSLIKVTAILINIIYRNWTNQIGHY